MTKEEAKAYAKQLLKDSGVSDEEITQYSKLFDNDKFAQGFIPRPEVDRSLDAERQKYKTHAERNSYLETEWLPQAKAAYDKNVKGIALLEKYQQLYGAIDDDAADPAARRRAASETGLSLEKVNELLDKRLTDTLSARDQATLDLMDIREDYMDRFKKRLPVKDFEKAVAEARKTGNNDSLQAIYKEWINPDLEKIQEESLKARDKRVAEEAVRDFASRNKIPADSAKREPSILSARLAAERKESGTGAKPNGDSKTGAEAFMADFQDVLSGNLKP